jgi:hypothetical protein
MAIKGELKDKMNPQEWRDFMQKRKNAETSKFKAIPTQTADGQKFKSILEADFYNRQWVRQRAGEVVKIEREVRYELIVNGVFIAAYMLDFLITEADGTIRYIDCKSQPTKTPLYLMKKQLMLALFDIRIEEVFE